MRSVVIMLMSVTVATLAAAPIARAVLPSWVWEEQSGAGASSSFNQAAAVEVVLQRLGRSTEAQPYRRALRSRGRVEYHSAAHWTVRLDDATWLAHGNGGPDSGRYAEPTNAAARRVEAAIGR